MKTQHLLYPAALITLLTCAPLQAAEYLIDTEKSHASILFRISHLGTSWLTGRFNHFSGSFSYDPSRLAASSVRVEIDVSSIDSNHAERDKHLRGEKYLNAEKYPDALFISTGFVPDQDGGGTMNGNLTLFGTTRPISIDVTKVGEGPDPWGGYRTGFSGTVEFRLQDFGMNFNLGQASETVYMTLNIEGIRQ